MEFFAKLMSWIGVSNREIDFVARLPAEIAEMILLNLDPRSLLNAARVSTKWMAVCKGSPRLRRVARRHLRREKRRTLSRKVMRVRRKVTASRCVTGSPTIAEGLPQVFTSYGTRFTIARVERPCEIKTSSRKDPSSPPNRSMFPTRSTLRLR